MVRLGNCSGRGRGHGEALSIPGTPAVYGSKGCIKGNEVILDDGTRTTTTALFNAKADAATKEKFYPHGLTDPYAISAIRLAECD